MTAWTTWHFPALVATGLPRHVDLRRLGERLALATLALGGTAAYAASFRFVAAGDPASVAGGVGVAAGAAWLVLLFVLWAIDDRGDAGGAVDLCLATMAVGMVFLLAAAGLNVLLWALGLSPGAAAGDAGFVAFHAVALGLGHTAMAAVFIRGRVDGGEPRGVAVRRWLLLDAAFAMVWLIGRAGGAW